MKFSLKLPEDQNQNQNHHYLHSPLLKAKIPITVFNQPFLTSISTTTTTTTSSRSSPPHLCFSFSSSFPSGPSLKFSYSPTSTASNPFSISLKSGLGLFGSPNNSPLVFTAHFSPSPTNPTFSLHFKPQFGNFSLKKTTFSKPPDNSNNSLVSGYHSNGGVNLDSNSHSNVDSGDGFLPQSPSSVWQEVKLEPCGGKDEFLSSDFRERGGVSSNNGIGSEPERQATWKNGEKYDGVFSGIAVMARTVLPVTKRVVINMRWGVNFPANLGTKKFPYLALNKIGIERVEEVKEEKDRDKVKSAETENSVADMEVLKGMCFWMGRDLELLEKENREFKQSLEQIKLGVSGKHFHRERDTGERKVLQPTRESSGEFGRRSKRSVNEDHERKETKKSTTQASDLESELQKAIKAASA